MKKTTMIEVGALSLALAACGGPAARESAERVTSGSEAAAAPRASVLAPPTELVAWSGDQAMPMPVAVTSFGAARLGDAVYTLGGYFGEPHHYVPENQSRALSRLSLAGGATWETLLEDGDGVQGVALVSDGSALYRIGGNRILRADGAGETGGGMISLRDVARWTPGATAWEPLPELPAIRSSHAAVMHDGTIYVAGGWALDGEGPDAAAWHRSMLVLRPEEGAWREVEAPFARRALAIAAAGSQVYVIGGLTPEREISARVDIYDPASGAWSQGPDYPADTFGIAALGIGDAVYASGRDGVLRRLRAGASAWEDVSPLAFTRFFHQLVPGTDGTLLALGGISGMHTSGRTRWVEVVPLEGRAQPSFAMVSIASPMAAKNRQGIFLHGDTLYGFGGNSSLEQHDFAPERFQTEGWALHVPSLSWHAVEPYPVPRQTMQTEVVGDQGIAVGGFGHDGTAARSHPEVYAYDFEDDVWTRRAGGLPRGGRTQFGLVAYGDQLWVFGGLDYDPSREGEEAFAHLTAVLSAPLGDAEAPFTESGVEMPGPRRAFAGTLHGDRYVMCGGMREGFTLVDGCIAFDFATRTFSELPAPAHTRLSADLVSIGERLYLVGGSWRNGERIETDPSVEVYDPAVGAWRVLMERVPMDLRHSRAYAYGDRILVYSAHTEEPVVRIGLITP